MTDSRTAALVTRAHTAALVSDAITAAATRKALKAAPRVFTNKQRTTEADSGVAMPDKSYPIPDLDALDRAVQSYGRAADPAAVKAHIIKRARVLNGLSHLPKDWKVTAAVPCPPMPDDKKRKPMPGY